MDAEGAAPARTKWRDWIGWILSVLPAAMLTMSGVMKIVQPQAVVEGFEHLGWPIDVAIVLGVVELACTAIYLIPNTAILGAILLTGYLGGAMATHVRIGEPFIPPLIMGMIIWLGIYLREQRLRALVPLRKYAYQVERERSFYERSSSIGGHPQGGIRADFGWEA